MRKTNRNTSLFVPLVGKTSRERQKEGLKLIKYLPRLTAVLPQSGKDAMKSPSFGTTCHFPHKGGRATGSTRYLTQGRENNGCFASSQNVGQALPDNKENLVDNSSCVVGPEQKLLRTSTSLNKMSGQALTYNGGSPSPLVGEDARRAGEGFSRGFTLIELLVVGLIIGILAAVALPQYQKAVMKSRLGSIKLFVKSVSDDAEIFYLENGFYPSSLEDLNNLPIPLAITSFAGHSYAKYNWGTCHLENTNGGGNLFGCQEKNIGYYQRFKHSPVKPNSRSCVAHNGDPIAASVCQQETRKTTSSYADDSKESYPY